jgi:Cu(I)/Ag(I) efflux system protein CusF
MKIRFLSLPSLALFILVSFPGAAPGAGHSGHEHGGASMPRRSAEADRLYAAVGVVDAVHEAEGKVTVSHQPVPALNWPAMTMRFALESPDQLEGLKPGDRVKIYFRNEGNRSIIVEIENLP